MNLDKPNNPLLVPRISPLLPTWFLGKNRNHVAHHIASTIEALLILGDIDLLFQEFSWIDFLLTGCHLLVSVVVNYVKAYYEAAMLFLGEDCQEIIDWLALMNG